MKRLVELKSGLAIDPLEGEGATRSVRSSSQSISNLASACFTSHAPWPISTQWTNDLGDRAFRNVPQPEWPFGRGPDGPRHSLVVQPA